MKGGRGRECGRGNERGVREGGRGRAGERESVKESLR